MAETVSEKLVDYALGVSINEVPSHVREAARKFLVDFLVNALLGYLDKRSRSFREVLPKCEGYSTIIGSFEKSCPLYAAALNAFQGHAQELDDFLPHAFAHVGTVAFPVVIAVAEELKLTWNDVIEAGIVGYETAARIGSYLGRSHYELFHATGTVGAISAALALGKLLRFDRETLTNAVGIAGSYASGLWEFISVGSSVKPFTPAHAALIALLSVRMAREGFKGPRTIFEGDRGVCRSMRGECRSFSLDLGRWYTVENHLKPWPSCRHSHSAIEASLKLRDKIDVNKVDSIVVYTYGEAIKVAGIRRVQGIDSAKFSIPHLVATALTYGRITIRDLESSLFNSNVISLRDKVELLIDERYDSMYPAHMPSRVVAGGAQVEILDPLGSPANPMELKDVLNKLGDLDVGISLEPIYSGGVVRVEEVFIRR